MPPNLKTIYIAICLQQYDSPPFYKTKVWIFVNNLFYTITTMTTLRITHRSRMPILRYIKSHQHFPKYQWPVTPTQRNTYDTWSQLHTRLSIRDDSSIIEKEKKIVSIENSSKETLSKLSRTRAHKSWYIKTWLAKSNLKSSTLIWYASDKKSKKHEHWKCSKQQKWCSSISRSNHRICAHQAGGGKLKGIYLLPFRWCKINTD